MKLKPIHIVDMNKTIPEPEMENEKKIIGFSIFFQYWLKTSAKMNHGCECCDPIILPVLLKLNSGLARCQKRSNLSR